MPTDSQFLEAAWSTAPAFGLDPTDITLLSHTENVVYRVDVASGDRRVLRLHRPGYNTLAELNSEVTWVKSLAEAGVPVPTALPTDEGEHYVNVTVGDETRYVGVVDWVNGQPLGRATGVDEATRVEVVDHYERIGELAAIIHAHHDQWVQPQQFTRRAWDTSGLVGEAPLWGRFWEISSLTDHARSLFTECRDALRSDLASLPMDRAHYGLIHADMHLGNLMADGQDLTVIDFDDAGYGWFVHELAVALQPVLNEPFYADARAALLAGYRKNRQLSPSQETHLDIFVTMRCLMLVGWLDSRPEVPDYAEFPAWVADAIGACQSYLDHRSPTQPTH